MDLSNILPYNLEPEYSEEELREIEYKDRANLCENGPNAITRSERSERRHQ